MRKCYLERDVCGEHVWYGMFGMECHLKSNQQELENFYIICFNMKICIQEKETSQINDHMDPHQTLV